MDGLPSSSDLDALARLYLKLFRDRQPLQISLDLAALADAEAFRCDAAHDGNPFPVSATRTDPVTTAEICGVPTRKFRR